VAALYRGERPPSDRIHSIASEIDGRIGNFPRAGVPLGVLTALLGVAIAFLWGSDSSMVIGVATVVAILGLLIAGMSALQLRVRRSEVEAGQPDERSTLSPRQKRGMRRSLLIVVSFFALNVVLLAAIENPPLWWLYATVVTLLVSGFVMEWRRELRKRAKEDRVP
jgi:MFS family permease